MINVSWTPENSVLVAEPSSVPQLNLKTALSIYSAVNIEEKEQLTN